MKKFEFSVEKLRRYQQQKLRLAELEIQRAKSDLNFANYKIFDYRIKDQLILK